MALPPAADAGPLVMDDAIEQLIAACARDERPALEALYHRTASRLYALTLAGTATTEATDQALIATYLDAFAEARGYVPGRPGGPMAWLIALLARHVPGLTLPPQPIKPVEPPLALWQRLDIALGLKRLDRHIKPGIATMPRGRDPMPNAPDSRLTQLSRRLALWRLTGAGALAVIAIASTVLAVPALRDPVLEWLATRQPDLVAARAATPPAPAPAPRATILRPNGESRVWRIALDGEALAVEAFPAFTHAGQGTLVLWALPEKAGNTPTRVGQLDPGATTHLALPAAMTAEPIAFVITLEPHSATLAGSSAPTGMPAGRALFSGRLEP